MPWGDATTYNQTHVTALNGDKYSNVIWLPQSRQSYVHKSSRPSRAGCLLFKRQKQIR